MIARVAWRLGGDPDADRPAGRVGLRRIPLTTVALLLVGGVLADLYGPEHYMGLPLLSAAPLVAGALLPFRLCLPMCLLACCVSVGVDLHELRDTSALLVNLADIALSAVLALALGELLRRQQRRLARARGVVEALQRAVLPHPPERVGPLRVVARYEAAQSEARVGGDLYAVQDTPFGVRAVIGDVRGKGVPAITSVAVAIGAFRQEAEHAPSLGDLARRLDEALSRESSRVGDVEEFTTAVLVEIPHDAGSARLLNRGHPAPYLISEGTVDLLEPKVHGLPLGMRVTVSARGDGSAAAGPADPTGPPSSAGPAAAEEGAADPAVETYPLPDGSSLLLYTDGLTEARDSRGAFYDPCSRLAARHRPEQNQLVDDLIADVRRWAGHRPQDDLALLVLTPVAGAPPEPFRPS